MVNIEDVKHAVWSCRSDKSPGPDGFTFGFTKRLQLGIHYFASYTKIDHPIIVSDYRPISLIGIQYKIIAKILTTRLAKVIRSIVSSEQSAFTKGRQILDGSLVLSEVINWCSQHKKKLLLFKIDFEKAYDSIAWEYLFTIMKNMGFSDKSARTSVHVNGKEFSLNRGLRQGDPMAPFLFIIAMEGLKINFHKSSMFGIGVPKTEVASVTERMRCKPETLPFSYLGVPIGASMSRIKNWSVILALASKEVGGLGIGSLHALNLTWLCFTNGDGELSSNDALWVKVIIAIHGHECLNSFSQKGRGLWASICSDFIEVHALHSVPASVIIRRLGNGNSVSFWRDLWVGNEALSGKFPRLYALELNKQAHVSERWGNGLWTWSWRRDIRDGTEALQLIDLTALLQNVQLVDRQDSWAWNFPGEVTFSVRQFRLFLSVLFSPVSHLRCIGIICPLKR
uniref:uncharacterized protein LOC122609157 n=1 Tax=Erigeron canadensis TaxID=72917 RepID=UPI001CB8EF4C|nr:uncharacterized protein LOC122609157 [Erigeron canadensis]